MCGVVGSGLVFQGLVAAGFGRSRGVGRSSDITLSGINRNGAASPTAILHSCVSNSYGGGNELGEVREGTQVHKKPLARQSVRGACLRGWRVYLLM